MQKYILTKLHNAYVRYRNSESIPVEERGITDDNKVSELISKLLTSDSPCMIARYGSNELDAICNYLGVRDGKNGLAASLSYIKSERPQWWWNENILRKMFQEAGFFPSTTEAITRFSELMIHDTQELDALGSWRSNEKFLKHYFKPGIIRFDREKINPFFCTKPWTLVLEKKKILIIHPFTESIKKQYAKRELLFPSPMLPEFDLEVFPSVQSIGGSDRFKDWFSALDYMKDEISKLSFDIALLGCGAYGFPLAAHIKRIGKKAVHIGGSLQLFFGIKGKRWESDSYVGTKNDYSTLFNEHWIRPQDTERPTAAMDVENGCYW